MVHIEIVVDRASLIYRPDVLKITLIQQYFIQEYITGTVHLKNLKQKLELSTLTLKAQGN